MEQMELVYEERRRALSALIDRMGRGAKAEISRVAGIDASYLARCAYPVGKPGKKNIGDEIVVKLNSAYPGWLCCGNVSAIVSEPESSPYVVRLPSRELTPDEQTIIDGFRRMTDRERSAWLHQARAAIAETAPENLENAA